MGAARPGSFGSLRDVGLVWRVVAKYCCLQPQQRLQSDVLLSRKMRFSQDSGPVVLVLSRTIDYQNHHSL